MKFYSGLLIAILIAFSTGCSRTPAYSAYKAKLSTNGKLVSTDIYKGNIAKIKAHLAKGNDVNGKLDDKFSLLTYGVIFKKHDVVKYLLTAGANPNIKGMGELTPIYHAKDREMARLLVEGGADIAAKTSYGGTLIAHVGRMNDAYSKMDTSSSIIAELVNNYQGLYDYLKNANFSAVLSYARQGKLAELKTELVKGASINEVDHNGNGALHLAAQGSHDAVVVFLINKKLSLTAKNSQGQTALDMVRDSKNSTAKILSCVQNKYCKSVAAFTAYLNKACGEQSKIKPCFQAAKKDIHGVFTNSSIQQRIAKLEYNDQCVRFKYAGCAGLLQKYSDLSIASSIQVSLDNYRPKGEKLYDRSCGEKGKTASCKAFIKKHPGFKSEAETSLALLYLGQKCRVKESGWFYKGSQCNAGYAHGVGTATSQDGSYSYKGRFVNGNRVNGKITENGQTVFDGEFKEGQRHGKGVCFYQGAPEECKYYAGQRIDALYKQRIELDKQREAMASQQKLMDKKLAAAERTRKQRAAAAARVSTRSSGGTNRLQECATLLLKKKACDQIGGFGGMACMALIPGGHNCF